jgi:UDP:flavonoid glycosyltransferase YjiC (YdhE family)
VRILFTTTPGRGHYQPMLGLARACRERGHEVLWAADEKVCEQLREAGFEATAAGLPQDAVSKALAERMPEIVKLPPADRPNLMFSAIFGPERAGPMLEDLLAIVQESEPALLVCEQAELAGPIAAAVAGVPNVTHAFGHPLPRNRLETAGEEMADLWEARGVEPGPYAGTYDHLYLDIYPDSLKTYDSPHIREVQPARPVADSAIEPPDPEWSDPGLPLVYVTFGTVFNTDADLIGTVVEGIRQLAVRVVVTCGPGREMRALGDQPSNVHVAQYIPQAKLLPHCAAVVSHAGSGTFLAALAEGLPQLLIPQAADQFLNAAAGAGAGAGIEIAPDSISAAVVEERITELLADPAYREAAQRVSDEIAAMPGPDDVAKELERRFA